MLWWWQVDDINNRPEELEVDGGCWYHWDEKEISIVPKCPRIERDKLLCDNSIFLSPHSKFPCFYK
jgi:hypothetical protein